MGETFGRVQKRTLLTATFDRAMSRGVSFLSGHVSSRRQVGQGGTLGAWGFHDVRNLSAQICELPHSHSCACRVRSVVRYVLYFWRF